MKAILKDKADNFYRSVYDKCSISPITYKCVYDNKILFEWRDMLITFYIKDVNIFIDMELKNYKRTYNIMEDFQNDLFSLNSEINYII